MCKERFKKNGNVWGRWTNWSEHVKTNFEYTKRSLNVSMRQEIIQGNNKSNDFYH